MKEKFESIVRRLISSNDGKGPLTGIEIAAQFRPDQTTPEATLRNLNAAFLISLCGSSHPLHSQAENFIKDLEKKPAWKHPVDFYNQGMSLVIAEIEKRCIADRESLENFDQLYLWIRDPPNHSNQIKAIKAVWRIFFPEGSPLLDEERETNVESLRRKRRIQITRLNPSPIQDPGKEILFTSNVLLTIPAPSIRIEDLALPSELKGRLRQVEKEPQVYWYDHPVQIGTEAQKNEVIYGLTGLDQAIEFEKRRGTVDKDTRVHCVLSVSVTHEGLREMARSYLEETLKGAKGIHHLHVYAMTGADTLRLVDDILAPAARHYLGLEGDSLLHDVIGVDGEYGKHYCFLKAISAFWQVFLDPDIKGTFKIDLDQVFPQDVLVKESGASAFEHFKTPLWGAEGLDLDGNPVELGMIAGALVNQKDIGRSLFTPDVTCTDGDIKADEWIFFSRLPQAISTEAEMMTRYTDGALDGRDQCVQRFHVTGGTCGILVESLRKYRPFTPSFMGRAEDQAYVLSVLFEKSKKNLRYVHKDGLIMRHDKDVFAGEAIRAAHTGKLVGDYARILLFSYYARGLPWPVKQTKRFIDPFTGCFASHIPLTVVYLRLALQGASFFNEGKPKEGFDLLQMGVTRLYKILDEFTKTPGLLRERYQREKQAWDIFYDLLDKVEKGLKEGDAFVFELREKARRLIKDCEIN
jgi:hypothetical protein